MNAFLAEVLDNNRWMRIAYSRVVNSQSYNKEVDEIVSNFLDDYAAYYTLTPKAVAQMYSNFTEQYSQHIRDFIKTGKYPIENGVLIQFERVEYDVVLILSIILSVHRHNMFIKLKSEVDKVSGKTLLIGVGPGIEIEFFSKLGKSVDAYDIKIADHIFKRYPDQNIHEKLFNGADVLLYDNIFAIELLEHLDDPISFVETCYKSLNKDGNFYFTTATNIPQADHLYNFSNIELFERKMESIGFVLQENLLLLHESIDSKLNAQNNWFRFKKSI